MRRSVLVVDDDRGARSYATLALQQAQHATRSAGNGVEALLAIENHTPDLVLTDLRMPEMDGLELITLIKQRWPSLPVILTTVVDEIPTVVEAIKLGAFDYLLKPTTPEVLLTTVAGALQRGQASELPVAVPDGPRLAGKSPQLVAARQMIALAGRSDINVLLVGETGTGKELAARAIHAQSDRSHGPFVAHNCSATPPDLFESQFFGHRAGAFTGAARDQLGLLAQADGGVLLLDELETLRLDHQAKLLRVLDDGCYTPLGARDEQQVSIRFVAATNRDPLEMMRQGALREDLYYRLRAFEIRMPALRERTGDIPELARAFLGERVEAVSGAAWRELKLHHWPGNVRELKNALAASEVFAEGGAIEPCHLRLTGAMRPDSQRTTPKSLAEFERWAIEEAVKATNGNLSHAADLLGIDRSTLRRKLTKLGNC